MSILNKIIKKVFGNKSEKDLKKILPIVDEINKEYKSLVNLSDNELKSKFNDICLDYQNLVKKTKNDLELKKLNNLDLNKELEKFDSEYLDQNLVRVFSIVKDVARRLCGTKFRVMDTEMGWEMVHYDVQLIGGIVLHKGKISEMKTGEGKTLVSTLPIVLNAITKKGVHVVTVNDYLAQRDSQWMGLLFNYLGLSVGCLLDRMSPQIRKEVYSKDIIYGTNSQFGFDYLRDNMVSSNDYKVQGEHSYAIIDEVDSVLIDEARTPLIISGSIDAPVNQDYNNWRNKIESLVRVQNKMVNELIKEAEDLLESKDKKDLGIKLLIALKGAPKNSKLLNLFQETGIKKLVHDTESDYIREKKVSEIEEQLYFVIDENSRITDLSEKGREFLSPKNPEYFIIPDLGEIYFKIDNMDISKEEVIDKKHEAQTIHGERSERIHIINKLLQAFCLYTKDNEYIIQEGKIQIVDEHTGRVLHGRRYSDGLHEAIEIKENVVVGKESQTQATITIQNYFRMYSKLAGMTGTALTEAQEFMEIYKLNVIEIPTNVPITRKDHNDYIYRSRREKFNAVILKARELSDRGQPVLVGTTSVEESEVLSKMLKNSKIDHNVLNAKQHQREAEIISRAGQKGSITISTNMAGRGTDIKLGEGVKEAGGLFILGTGRHESRRIDLQLRGRAGRQGDAGESIFYLSLEDDLMRIFGSDRIATVMDKLGIEDGEVITHSMVSKSVQRAQQKLETRNFSIRKHVLEYDMVMNRQREIVYNRRTYFLNEEQITQEFDEIIEEFVDQILEEFSNGTMAVNKFNLNGLNEELLESLSIDTNIKNDDFKDIESLSKIIKDNMFQIINYKKESIGEIIFNNFIQFVSLKEIDKRWRDHLNAMDLMREGINLRAYGQKNPLIEYKKEGYILFEEMMFSVNKEILKIIFRTNLKKVDESKIVIENNMPQNIKLSHKQISGLSLSNQRQAPSQDKIISNIGSNNILNKKYKRNDKITISDGNETKIIKFKKAEDLLNKGWNIVE